MLYNIFHPYKHPFLEELPIDECAQVFAREEFIGNVPQLLGGDGFDAAVEDLGAFVLAIVEEGLGHAEGGALEVIGGYAYLTDKLFLGGSELECGKWTLAQAVEFP